MVEANRLSSMILYGPPGIGKTEYRLSHRWSWPSMPFGPLMRQLIVKNVSRNRQKKPVFRWSCTTPRQITSRHEPSKTFSCHFWKVAWSSWLVRQLKNPFLFCPPAIRSRVQIFNWNLCLTKMSKKKPFNRLTDPERGFDFPVEWWCPWFLSQHLPMEISVLPSTHWI